MVKSAYPVGYRTAAARAVPAPGFQEVPNYKPPRPPSHLPRPANDNWPVPKDVKLPKGAFRGLRRAYRILPWVRYVLTAYEIIEWVQNTGVIVNSSFANGWTYTDDGCTDPRSKPAITAMAFSTGYLAATCSYASIPYSAPTKNPWDPVAANIKSFRMGGPKIDMGFGYRSYTSGRYSRAVAGSTVGPKHWWEPHQTPAYKYVPSWAYALDPFALPVYEFAPQAEPVPYRLQPRRIRNPMRYYQYEAGYDLPAENPGDVPDEVVPIWPVDPNPEPTPHDRPPGRGNRDRKSAARNGAGVRVGLKLIKYGVNPVSEAIERLDAVWKALPLKDRTMEKGKATSPQQKALDIYNHWRDLDVGKAILNLVANEMSDMGYGMVGRALAKSVKKNPYWWSFHGLQSGGWDSPPSIPRNLRG